MNIRFCRVRADAVSAIDFFGAIEVDIDAELAALGPTGYRPLRVRDTLFRSRRHRGECLAVSGVFVRGGPTHRVHPHGKAHSVNESDAIVVSDRRAQHFGRSMLNTLRQAEQLIAAAALSELSRQVMRELNTSLHR